jgi:hypothetical protein
VRAMNPGAVEEAGVPKEHRPLLPRRFSSVGGAAEKPSFRPRRFCGRWGLVCRRSAGPPRGHFSPFASFMSSRPSSGWPSSQDGSDEQMFGVK